MGASGAGGDAYQIEKSLRFDDGDSAYLNRTPSSSGSPYSWTWSGWVKLNRVGSGTSYLLVADAAPYVDAVAIRAGGSLSHYEAYVGWTVTSEALLRDPSAWYHLVCAVDTTQSTDSDRIKLYINGEVVTSFTTTPTYSTEDRVLGINASSTRVQLGRWGTTYGSDFQLAEVHYIDGEQLTASDFGETNATTGQWVPKEYTGDHNYSERIDLSDTTNNQAIDVVIDREVDKCWIKSNGSWLGGGDPSDTESTPTFNILNGETATNLYWFTTGYNNAHTITIGASSETGIQPAWDDSTTPFSHTSTVVTGTPSDTYVSARTGAMTDGNVYAFTYTIDASSSNYTGWFLSTSTSYSSGTPDQQTSGNTVGARFHTAEYRDYVGVYGDFQNINTYLDDGQLPILGGTGANSFYLKFNGTDLGEDSSGNDNDLTANNLANTGGGTVDYLSNITGSLTNAIDAFSASYINNYINTSTFAVTNTAWIGAWQGLSATENVFTPPGGLPVTSSLIVYYGAYSNPVRTVTLLITYTDTTTETDTFTSGNQNWMKAFTASNASGKTIQTISITNSVTNNSNYQSFGGFVIDGAILESYNPATDVSPDTPTPFDDEGNGTGNYCTMNPVHATATLQNGNLDIVPLSGHSNNYGTLGMSSGKWYWEVHRSHFHGNSGSLGFHGSASASKKEGTTWAAPATNADQHVFYIHAQESGLLYNGQNGASFSFTYSSTPVLPTDWCSDAGYWMFCVDMDNQKAWIGKDEDWWGWNGTAYTTTGGDPANGTNPTFVLDVNDTYFPFNGTYGSTPTDYTYTHNFGQRPFAYTPPSGYKALNTYNLDDTTILSGTYVGNGDADGPFVWMNATPATLKIGTSNPPTSLVTFDPDDVDPLANGFKIRNASTNNGSGTTYYWLATTDNAVESAFKYANAQTNE